VRNVLHTRSVAASETQTSAPPACVRRLSSLVSFFLSRPSALSLSRGRTHVWEEAEGGRIGVLEGALCMPSPGL
jgi:hypothetical protein